MATKLKVKLPVAAFAGIAAALGTLRIEFGEEMPTRLALRGLRDLRVLEPDAQVYFQREEQLLERWAKRDASGARVEEERPGGHRAIVMEETEEAKAAIAEFDRAANEELEYELEPLPLADFTYMEQMSGIQVPRFVKEALEPLIVED